VYSELGQGSTLNVFLPLEGGARASESQRVPDSSAFGGSETILVVEDDETVRGFVYRTLTRNGYTTHVASSSEEALSLFESLPHAPNLVLTDVVLPGMNGPAMFQQMQLSEKALRVLYMSGYSGDTISHQGVHDANSLLLQKPFSTRDLLVKVRSVLNA
jgi:DNA-binding response OmpR family regulator